MATLEGAEYKEGIHNNRLLCRLCPVCVSFVINRDADSGTKY